MRKLRLITKIKLYAVAVFFTAVCSLGLYLQYNVEWSARVAWGEARGEPDGGMQAVLNVMANRKKDPRFPKSLSSVAKQAYQFTAYNDDDPNRPKLEAVSEEDPHYIKAKRLAMLAQVGLLPDITGGATYYHSTDIERPDYLSAGDVTATIGKHVFYAGDTR